MIAARRASGGMSRAERNRASALVRSVCRAACRALARRYSRPRPSTVSAARTATGSGSLTGGPSRRARARAKATAATPSRASPAQAQSGSSFQYGGVGGSPPEPLPPPSPPPLPCWFPPWLTGKSGSGEPPVPSDGGAPNWPGRWLAVVQVQPDHPAVPGEQSAGQRGVAVLADAVVAERVGRADQDHLGGGVPGADERAVVAPGSLAGHLAVEDVVRARNAGTDRLR